MLLFVSPFHWFFTSDRFDVWTIVRCSNPRRHYYFWSFFRFSTYKTNVNKQSAELSNVFSGVARKIEFCSLQKLSLQCCECSAGCATYFESWCNLVQLQFQRKLNFWNVECRISRVLISCPVKSIIVNLTGVTCSFEFPACLTCLEALVWLVVCFTCQEQVKKRYF